GAKLVPSESRWPRLMTTHKITYCTICNTDFDGFGPRFIEENDTGNTFYSEPGPRLSDSRNNREVEFSRVAWALDGDIGDRSKQCLPSGQYAEAARFPRPSQHWQEFR